AKKAGRGDGDSRQAEWGADARRSIGEQRATARGRSRSRVIIGGAAAGDRAGLFSGAVAQRDCGPAAPALGNGEDARPARHAAVTRNDRRAGTIAYAAQRSNRRYPRDRRSL